MIPYRSAIAVLVLAVLTGCSSGEPDETFKPLTLKEQATTVVKSEGGYQVNWAAVLTNANPWHFGENAVATIVGRDAKGAQVLKTEQPLDAVPPAGSLAFSGEATTATAPVKVTVGYRSAQWRKAARIPSAFREFPASRVLTTPQKDGTYLVTGEVSNPYTTPASSLVVSALLRDKAGRLLGGGTTYVDDVTAGRPPRFILTVAGLPKGTELGATQVAARTWGATARPFEELALAGALPEYGGKPTTPPFAKDRGRQAFPSAE